MSYPSYTAAYPPASGYPQSGYPPQSQYGASPPGPHGYPDSGYGGYPQQHGGPGFPQPPSEPGFHVPSQSHGGYNAQYTPSYGPSYGSQAPPPHNPQYPGATGYGAPPAQSHSRSHSPVPSPQSQYGYGAAPPHSSYGQPHHDQHRSSPVPPPSQHGYGSPAPRPAGPTPPARFYYNQKDGFDCSGSIKDASGKTVFKLKDEADKHSFFTAYTKSRPLAISRADGTKIAEFHWKDSPEKAQLTCWSVWGAPGSKGTKLKVAKEVLDQDLKFRLPSGQAFEWDGPDATGVWNLLDHQQLEGEGFDVRGKTLARYSPHTETTDATLEVLGEGMAIPDLLEAMVMTSFQLEWMTDNKGNTTEEVLSALADALDSN
ncbi:hypothetical protein EIP91_000727 [Steccherinum ochraceum]|uniref:Uncharacterized protein n=1 Tax=Steccherinum ochraceum TaxID=92696 RepID=A0A4R0RNT6_9APHY|nr:hypothetical protein EIP91_000727 [Steccherinum ochraceum]